MERGHTIKQPSITGISPGGSPCFQNYHLYDAKQVTKSSVKIHREVLRCHAEDTDHADASKCSLFNLGHHNTFLREIMIVLTCKIHQCSHPNGRGQWSTWEPIPTRTAADVADGTTIRLFPLGDTPLPCCHLQVALQREARPWLFELQNNQLTKVKVQGSLLWIMCFYL